MRAEAPVDRYRAAAHAHRRSAACGSASRAPRPTSTPRPAGSSRADTPSLPDGAHRGRISVAPGAVDAVGHALDADRRRSLARRDRRRNRARRGRRRCGADGGAAIAHEHGGWLLREAGGERRRRVRARAPQRRAHAPHQGRVRPDRQVLTGTPAAVSADRAAAPRRRRARRVRRVRTVPAALPDVPRDRARDRVAARAASPRCAWSSSTARRSTTPSRPR